MVGAVQSFHPVHSRVPIRAAASLGSFSRKDNLPSLVYHKDQRAGCWVSRALMSGTRVSSVSFSGIFWWGRILCYGSLRSLVISSILSRIVSACAPWMAMSLDNTTDTMTARIGSRWWRRANRVFFYSLFGIEPRIRTRTFGTSVCNDRRNCFQTRWCARVPKLVSRYLQMNAISFISIIKMFTTTILNLGSKKKVRIT